MDDQEADVLRSLGRVESKVDILLHRTADHNDRIRDLEKSRNWLAGAMAVLTIVWGAILKFAGGKG